MAKKFGPYTIAEKVDNLDDIIRPYFSMQQRPSKTIFEAFIEEIETIFYI